MQKNDWFVVGKVGSQVVCERMADAAVSFDDVLGLQEF
jgi:hypothetical protein